MVAPWEIDEQKPAESEKTWKEIYNAAPGYFEDGLAAVAAEAVRRHEAACEDAPCERISREWAERHSWLDPEAAKAKDAEIERLTVQRAAAWQAIVKANEALGQLGLALIASDLGATVEEIEAVVGKDADGVGTSEAFEDERDAEIKRLKKELAAAERSAVAKWIAELPPGDDGLYEAFKQAWFVTDGGVFIERAKRGIAAVLAVHRERCKIEGDRLPRRLRMAGWGIKHLDEWDDVCEEAKDEWRRVRDAVATWLADAGWLPPKETAKLRTTIARLASGKNDWENRAVNAERKAERLERESEVAKEEAHG